MSGKKKALFAIIACVLFWGFSFISIKVTLEVFPPMSLGMLRFSIAVILLFFIKHKLAPREKLKAKDIPLLFSAGLSGVTFYFFFENNGVSLVSASEASIAIGSIPVLTMISDWLGGRIIRFYRRHKGLADNSAGNQGPARTQWLGALISIGGVWLVAGVSFALSGSALGYIYMAGAALSWVAYSFLTRSLKRPRIYIVFWQSVAGLMGFVPFALMEIPLWGKADMPVILHLLFLGLCCSALGYWFYVQALEGLGVSGCAVFINLIPVVTVICGFFVLGERLTPLQWLGAALVISGVYLAM